jgi:PAS domain S-box-containing protein
MLDLIDMAREELRTRLRGAVRKAIREDERVTVTGVRVRRDETRPLVKVTVQPIKEPNAAEGLLLVSFEEAPDAAAAAATASPTDLVDDSIVRQLEDELQATKEDLHSTIEELETTNEELKASNEEAMSMNEELQSTNEELESSKEELQSLNEELTTVNSQLQDKVQELEAANDDLANLLGSTHIATIFLDTAFCIKRFTPTTTELLNLIPTDVGRPISDIAHKFVDEELRHDAELVLDDKLTQTDKEVQTDDGRSYVRRVIPYRTGDNRIDGVVITFVDITNRKQAEEAVQEARLYAESIVETVREPLLILDANLRVLSANRSYYGMFQASRANTENQLVYEVSSAQWDVPKLRALLDEVLRENRHFDNFEIECTFEHMGLRTMLLNARSISRTNTRPDLILLAIEDVTERKQLVDKAIADAIWFDQQRIGQKLHDELGQQLTGLGMIAKNLQRKLQAKSLPEASAAADLTQSVRLMHTVVRRLIRELHPVGVDANGLMAALKELAAGTEKRSGVKCAFQCGQAVLIEDNSTATELFHIAREAVTNALRHAMAKRIAIRLKINHGRPILQVRDDGVGISGDLDETAGMGLRIMRYRAGMIGATLGVQPADGGGTSVTCTILKDVHSDQEDRSK